MLLVEILINIREFRFNIYPQTMGIQCSLFKKKSIINWNNQNTFKVGFINLLKITSKKNSTKLTERNG